VCVHVNSSPVGQRSRDSDDNEDDMPLCDNGPAPAWVRKSLGAGQLGSFFPDRRDYGSSK